MADNSQKSQIITKNTNKIIYKDLSYKLVGLLFELYKTLGGDYQEKYYQRGLEKFLLKENINYKREACFNVILDNEVIGKHFIDFVIDGKIALDLKKGKLFRMGDIKQMLMYLENSNLKLGILAYFSSSGVRTKRIVNKHFRDIS